MITLILILTTLIAGCANYNGKTIMATPLTSAKIGDAEIDTKLFPSEVIVK